MLYDGGCPVCAREVSFLRTLKKAPQVNFVNIATPGFDPQPFTHKPLGALLGDMHVYDAATGVMHTRVDAFRKLYSTLGFSFLDFTRTWPFSAAADAAYTFIARHKHRVAFLFRQPELK